MARAYNIDPEVGQARARVVAAIRTGNQEAEGRHRKELHDAKILAAAKAVAAQLPELSPEKRARVAALLGGA